MSSLKEVFFLFFLGNFLKFSKKEAEDKQTMQTFWYWKETLKKTPQKSQVLMKSVATPGASGEKYKQDEQEKEQIKCIICMFEGADVYSQTQLLKTWEVVDTVAFHILALADISFSLYSLFSPLTGAQPLYPLIRQLCWKALNIRSDLSSRAHLVNIALQWPLTCGVPQGSILGPLLFSTYMLSLRHIIHKYKDSCFCHVNNTRIYAALTVKMVTYIGLHLVSNQMLQDTPRRKKYWSAMDLTSHRHHPFTLNPAVEHFKDQVLPHSFKLWEGHTFIHTIMPWL